MIWCDRYLPPLSWIFRANKGFGQPVHDRGQCWAIRLRQGLGRIFQVPCCHNIHPFKIGFMMSSLWTEGSISCFSRDESALTFKKGEIIAVVPKHDAYTEKVLVNTCFTPDPWIYESNFHKTQQYFGTYRSNFRITIMVNEYPFWIFITN